MLTSEMPTQRDAQILDRVRATPVGYVRTYGDVSPGAPRAAGAALHACEDPSVPWHRIVRADGSLAKGPRQRRLLEREGVPFNGERVNMRVARLPEF
jgi:methylated-DNA-protein-cysteine methyltransferase-like protein